MFEDRERAEEAHFAHNRELAFQAQARRNKLFGLWAAGRRGLDGADAQRYASSLTLEDFPHYRATVVLHRVASDLAAAGIATGEQDLAIALATSADRAQCEVWAGMTRA